MTTTRRYRPGDRAACQHVFFRAVHDGTSEFYSDAQRSAWAPSENIDPGAPDKLSKQMTWVAEDEGTLTGFMSLRADGYLDMAFVLPQAHGRGVADALYARTLSSADKMGLDALFVDASHMARRFFAKHGWRVENREEYPLRGQLIERFRMTYPLQEADT